MPKRRSEQQNQLPMDLPASTTTVRESARGLDLTLRPTSSQILAKGTGFISNYDYSLNPYIGCEFGCGYCYAANFSPDKEKQANWGQWTSGKTNAAQLISHLLYTKRNADPKLLDGKTIYMSTATDPYQPVEKQQEITREILKVMVGEAVPSSMRSIDPPKPWLVVQTRSPLVARDIDLLRNILSNGGRVQINMTVTTDSEPLRRAFEPKCMTNQARITAVTRINQAGIPTCITLTPLLGVDDEQSFIKALIDTGSQRFITQDFHGASSGKYTARTRAGADEIRDRIYSNRGLTYDTEYRRFVTNLKTALAANDRVFAGEGKAGFEPPW